MILFLITKYENDEFIKVNKSNYSGRFKIEDRLVYVPANCKVNLPNNRTELGDS